VKHRSRDLTDQCDRYVLSVADEESINVADQMEEKELPETAGTLGDTDWKVNR